MVKTSKQQRRNDLEEWLNAVFPFPLERDERFAVQPFWKSDWPNTRRRTLSAQALFFGHLASLTEFLASEGRTTNLGVATSVFRPVSGLWRRANAHFSRTATLGFDLDCGEGKPFANVPAAVSRIRHVAAEYSMPPLAVVSSGVGIQVYYGLSLPLSDAQIVASLLTRMASLLNGDKSGQSICRVLRPPGTLSYKYDPPKEVTLLEVASSRIPADVMAARLPKLRPAPAPKTRRRARPSSPTTVRASRDLKALLNGAMPSRYRGDKSARDFAVTCSLLESGHSAEDVRKMLEVSVLGQQAQARKANPDDYLDRTVTKAAESVQRQGRNRRQQ